MMGSLIDLTNNVYGDFTVLYRSGRDDNGKVYWYCRCSCGKEKDVVSQDLLSGKTTGCGGCHKKQSRSIDLTGKRFGKLAALEIAGHNKGVLWKCQCDCGNIHTARATYLINGIVKSCGCYRDEFRKLDGQGAAKRRLLYNYKKGALERGVDFSLTDEQFFSLTKRNCYYCDTSPSNVMKPSHYDDREPERWYIYNGIDRLDSNFGYVSDNVVACCTTCNIAKNSVDFEQFKRWIKRVYLVLHRKLSDKTPGELIDALTTIDIKCFMEQEKLCSETDPIKIAEAAKKAQELNAKRNKVMRSIDALLDFNEDMATEKSYDK